MDEGFSWKAVRARKRVGRTLVRIVTYCGGLLGAGEYAARNVTPQYARCMVMPFPTDRVSPCGGQECSGIPQQVISNPGVIVCRSPKYNCSVTKGLGNFPSIGLERFPLFASPICSVFSNVHYVYISRLSCFHSAAECCLAWAKAPRCSTASSFPCLFDPGYPAAEKTVLAEFILYVM